MDLRGGPVVSHMSELDPRLKCKIDEIFPPEDRAEAVRLISDDSNIGVGPLPPRVPGEVVRIRAAALKISGGSIERLRDYVGKDFRDLLVWSGLGAGTAVDDWLTPGGLGPRIERKIDSLFARADRDEVRRLLGDEANFSHGPPPSRAGMTHVRAALLKLSGGSVERVRAYIGDDYRQLLLRSGFENPTAADEWLGKLN